MRSTLTVAACIALSACGTPTEVVDVSKVTSKNIVDLKERIAVFGAEAEQSAVDRGDVVVRLRESTRRSNTAAENKVYVWRHGGAKAQADLYESLTKRIDAMAAGDREASQIAATTTAEVKDTYKPLSPLSPKLTEASKGVAELAEGRGTVGDAKFLFKYAEEVHKDIKKRQKEAEEARAEANKKGSELGE
jgi:hypothetical protein